MTQSYVVTVAILSLGLALARGAAAQDEKEQLARALDARQSSYADVAMQIWNYAEVGYQEEMSSALLQAQLQDAGFRIEAGVEGMPTAFVASWGTGRPIIGILAEFDALPGFSQDAVPEVKPIEGRRAGHACGHHLYGTASTAAAISVKEWLEREGRTGTIRLYGTPAEEGGSGKVYMVRGGLFDDVDAVLSWHASDRNDAGPSTNLANKSAKFRFRGVSAHAAGAPDRARSALDGVEAMNLMANTAGGNAPNVVPDYAEVYYYVRNPNPGLVEEIFERLVKVAEGAATGTGTTMEYEIIGGTYSRLPNMTLARVVDANLRKVGGISYNAEEQAFAEAIHPTLGPRAAPLGIQEVIQPFEMHTTYASSDAGDISWVVPSASFTAATWVAGTPAHSWQAVAAGGTTIGIKAMMVAAKTLATSAMDLYANPAAVESARQEMEERRGPDFRYRALLGDRAPALDYRR
jgi:aminobenzoyl-glutamate utilization protein B